MRKVLIIGGGFAGLAALRRFAFYQGLIQVTLIDKKRNFDFLPLLPDLIGRGLKPQFLSNDIGHFALRKKAIFINDEVVRVDLEKNQVYTKLRVLDYDYLIIACGSETNFYGQGQIQGNAFKIDDVSDIERLMQALRRESWKALVISGGGYTGIEVATNLKKYLEKNKSSKKILIVEFAPQLLGNLPPGIGRFVQNNLEKLKIEVLLSSTVQRIEKDKVYISGGRIIEEAILIWTAGVKAPDFVSGIPQDKNRQGRLKVDEYLKVRDNCFVVGDAAEFSFQGRPIRMAVQFALKQGEIAARNIVNLICGMPLIKYRPSDLGYVIPMANNNSCGIVFGIYVRGLIATTLHYLMCIYRSRSLKNKIGIIKDLLRPS